MAFAEDVKAAQEARMNGYIVKLLDVNLIPDTIRMFLFMIKTDSRKMGMDIVPDQLDIILGKYW